MGINFNLKKVANFETVCYLKNEDGTESQKAATEALIFLCGMHIGIPEITSKNVKEVFERISMFESCFYCLVNTPEVDDVNEEITLVPTPITVYNVKDHIGLKTNGEILTKRQYHAKIIRRLREDAEDKFSYDPR